MDFITGLIMGVAVFIVVAYAIIFNAIDHQINKLDCQLAKLDCQLDKLRERINDLEDEINDNEGDFLRDSDGNPIILIDDEDEDLEEGDV